MKRTIPRGALPPAPPAKPAGSPPPISSLRSSIFTALVIASCGPSQPLQHPTGEVAATPAQPAPAAQPMQLELTALVARGELHVLDGDGWRPLAAGQSVAGATEIFARRRAAMVSLGHGDAAGRLWLRAGTRVRIGQTAAGLQLTVLDGRIRIRHGGAELPVSAGGKPIDGDYLIDAASMLPTAVFPELAAWSLALERDDAGAGVGRMEVASAAGAGAVEALELRKLDVRVRTEGDLAVTEVEHVFHNPADGRPREGTFRFPVPDGAMLTGLAMEIDGKLVEGEIVERDRARQIYDEVVDSMQDPALLEWEAGNWFKLRVFPIPAQGDKRVVIRYTAPLSRTGHGYEYAYDLAIANASAGGAAPGAIVSTGEDPRPTGKAGGVPTPLVRASPIGELSITVDGKQVAHETGATGLEIAVPVATPPVVMRETRKDATYTAVRVAPDASLLVAPPVGKAGLDVAIVFDTSRSSLEGRKLADQLLQATLAELGPTDRFVVLASDVSVTPSAAGLQPVTTGAIGNAQQFLAAIEPDGASDLGAALTAAGALHPGEVIYIGDGIPTWGEQKPAALGALADRIGAPIHAALIGKGATTSLWGDLAGRTGGRAIVVRKADDAARFALVASHAREIPRLVAGRIVAGGDAQVFPQQAGTLYQGDELVALIKTAPGQAPESLTLTAMAGGKPVSQRIALPAAAEAPGVAQRFGAQLIAQLEAGDADRETVVAASRDYGVLSKYTSLLVLENDEAYRKYNIERKQEQLAQQVAQAPQVTGGDLDTLGARRASLSPDEIQPGDPEVKVPAPADAREVLVSFPFGETKRAVWDAELDAWMVRFLIDKDTPDGAYTARVTITHADGRVQLMSLPYTVDTHAPAVQLTARRVAGGYQITARQTDGDAGRKDADKVEVVLPDGTILALTQHSRGKFLTCRSVRPDPLRGSPSASRPVCRFAPEAEFEGVWQTAALDQPVTLRVVVHDRALNQATVDLVVGAER
ncbi:MAG TPA: VIT and VWA domain-containing protein [Kofleriaceae bacterium]|nr:VIT and VWA domain-containing protein [Kofleriaceae bacterium]